MAIVGVLAVAAAAAAAYAAYQQGQAQAESYRYQSQIAENQADAAKNAAEVAARQTEEKNRRIQAAARARVGASGVETTEGSPLLVLMDNAAEAELEAAQIRYAGKIQQQGFQAESHLLTFEGHNARAAGNTAAVATLLGGAASAYGGYKRGQGKTTTTGTDASGYGGGSGGGAP